MDTGKQRWSSCDHIHICILEVIVWVYWNSILVPNLYKYWNCSDIWLVSLTFRSPVLVGKRIVDTVLRTWSSRGEWCEALRQLIN